jgi:hypothetical protein
MREILHIPVNDDVVVGALHAMPRCVTHNPLNNDKRGIACNAPTII